MRSRFLADGMLYADAIEQSHCRHVMGALSGLVSWANGDWDNAATTGRQTIVDRGCRRAAAMARWAVGFVALGRGDYEAAEVELRAALSVGVESGAVDLILPPLWGLAEAALLADRPDEAAGHCHEAIQRARAVGERALLAPFVVTGVRAEQAAGRPDAAEAWLAACAEHLSGMPEVARPALDHAGGLVALASGATGVARQKLEAAIVGWDGAGADLGGHLGAPRPRELPDAPEPVRRSGRAVRWTPGPWRPGLTVGRSRIERMPCRRWREVTSRSMNRGAH